MNFKEVNCSREFDLNPFCLERKKSSYDAEFRAKKKKKLMKIVVNKGQSIEKSQDCFLIKRMLSIHDDEHCVVDGASDPEEPNIVVLSLHSSNSTFLFLLRPEFQTELLGFGRLCIYIYM